MCSTAAPGVSQAMRGHLAMLMFSGLVAGSFSLGGMVANRIEPEAFNALRFWLAAAIIGAVAAAVTGLRRSDFAAPWRYLALGLCFGIYFVLMFEGLKTATPVSTAAVFTLTPILAAGFGWLLLRQRLTGRIALGLGIGAAGALWVIFRADIAALLRFQIGAGEAIFFWGCVAHAFYTPLVRRLNRGESPLVFTFGTLVAGGVLLTVWAMPDILATDWLSLPPIVWIALLYTTVFASAVTFVLVQYATLRLPSSKVMAYTYLTPSWVIVWEVALGNPAPPLLLILGVLATAGALVLLLRPEPGG